MVLGKCSFASYAYILAFRLFSAGCYKFASQWAQRHPSSRKLSLQDLLHYPMSRILKYPLLLAAVEKRTPDGEGKSDMSARVSGGQNIGSRHRSGWTIWQDRLTSLWLSFGVTQWCDTCYCYCYYDLCILIATIIVISSSATAEVLMLALLLPVEDKNNCMTFVTITVTITLE